MAAFRDKRKNKDHKIKLYKLWGRSNKEANQKIGLSPCFWIHVLKRHLNVWVKKVQQ
tara:strand:- start:203 stop:373 length:171 start_codon:yes stop_codon:yes gene_type:complete